jgi:enoyl-[acyl-carrier protein] reductase I
MLQDRKILIIGVANDQSIAYGCAAVARAAGADLAITYLNAKAEPHVRPLAEALGAAIILPLDVSVPGQLEAVFDAIGTTWGRLDGLVHSIAFSPRDDLHGRVTDCSAEGFGRAMDISVHSFIRAVKRAEPLMTGGGSCIAMSYHGAQKVVSTYNLMGPVKAALEASAREMASELGASGIRVNIVSPGPLKTRAASGIADFDAMLEAAAQRAPTHQLVTIEDCGALTAFLLGDGAKAITGGVHYVDGGLNIMA